MYVYNIKSTIVQNSVGAYINWTSNPWDLHVAVLWLAILSTPLRSEVWMQPSNITICWPFQ